MFEAVTNAIRVQVQPSFVSEKSHLHKHVFIWSYRVRICNLGQDTVQLRSRYWRIVDADGNIHEVRGRGVVGEEPVLVPNASFEYSSGTPLDTSSGFMSGHYEMENQNQERFYVDIPLFSLDKPGTIVSIH